ncbi:MAG: branched-chain amino acid ABC transporter permease, partial [Alicyclobacillus sp.]|nr:branched-chain amino acid ABC transporter permease [Alicyclobacillus sp.]
MTRRVCEHHLLDLACVAVLAAVGWLGGPALKTMFLTVFVIGMLAISWDILARSGCMSVGQGAVFGFGAYFAAITSQYGWSLLGQLGLAELGMGVFSFLFGLVTLRLRGLYLSLCTLALGILGQALVLMMPGVTGGAGGLSVPMMASGSVTGQFLIMALALGIVVGVSNLSLHSTMGVVLFSIRDAPNIVQCSGRNLTLWRVAALMLSWSIAVGTGVMYAHLYGYINADDVLQLSWSVAALAAAIIGGVDSSLGSVLGALMIALLNTYAAASGLAGLDQVIYGALLVLVLLTLRGGLWGG